ncbi:hypothetical protein NHL50_13870 [Acidimicrobiia bacterium EGI L10123]|uniref:hypothetical protein n=1 Tax=Salinilacustrithrix flava TaxID=2957203 RepID=UPI003D7C3336|nr:hypothetical protein [Acidimicrobiia bacterium EGI L10123]
MSSLWTPGGEVPVDRSRGGSEPPPSEATAPRPGSGGPPSEEELAAQAAELQRFLLEAPAEEIVAQHAMGLYELAVIHLSQPEPRLGDARLAIDALVALVDGLEGRLGEVGTQLRQTLPQLQMAFVQIADRGGEGQEPTTERTDG